MHPLTVKQHDQRLRVCAGVRVARIPTGVELACWYGMIWRGRRSCGSRDNLDLPVVRFVH